MYNMKMEKFALLLSLALDKLKKYIRKTNQFAI